MSLIASAPPAIIYINDDIPLQIQQWISRQLKIDIILDGYEFNSIIENDPEFVDRIRLSDSRLMVLINYIEQHDRQHADIVAYVRNGLISTQKNKFGPPIESYQVLKIHWGQFGIFVKKIGPGSLDEGCKTCNTRPKCIIAQYDPKRFNSSCSCLTPKKI